MEMKLVSVYIPTHNRCHLLERAIKSVQNQRYEMIEILVCDDGSTDATEKLVKAYQNVDPRIIYLKNESPRGACSARNLGINNAKGYYITGLDDDDEFLPNRVDSFVKIYEQNNYAFLSSSIVYDHGTRKTVGYNKKSLIKPDDLLFNNTVGSQVFTRTVFLQNIGGFDEEFKAWQDYDTWLRLAIKYGEGFNIKEPTYIQHLSHEFGRITNSKNLDDGYQQFIDKHSELLSKNNRRNLKLNYIMAKNRRLTCSEILEVFSLNNYINLLKYQMKKILHPR